MCNLRSEKVRLLFECGFYTRIYGVSNVVRGNHFFFLFLCLEDANLMKPLAKCLCMTGEVGLRRS